MSYFNLRKRDPEPEPDEEVEEQPEETEDDPDEEPPKPPAHGPIVTGCLGPGYWLAARFNTGVAWGVHVVAVWAVGFYGGWIAAGVILVWLLTVLFFIPREALERSADAIERLAPSEKPAAPEAEAPPKAAPADVHAATVEWVQRQIGNTQGVHLRDLLQHAQQHGMFEGLDVTTFRTHLERWGIPVRSRVRVRGKGVTVGIHRDDLSPSPTVPSPPTPQDPPNSGLHPA